LCISIKIKNNLGKKPIERCLGQKDRACAPSQTGKKKPACGGLHG